ncbi:restriction endonuclease [Clostridium sp. 2-1]|uniref:restriction endonuclease subunit S n=1 Tax=Clostridium TaxID=1485 RepID=UPI000CDA00A5|nr:MULTISPECIES: restriction endonuclease subunit S [Clostridium]MBN7576277.1 restriction endonuclease subunit S [Clostridium beijerinckii]MBN7579719.1 restriction endonuclease subunit S [Clostridium beijerinckii]MBN7585350.1 restriction endonuclease subunit S [Clostridium beijerinckii]MBO0520807.1 restriction endonuclease subunit S [Clostridium beijerinckii]POO88856.1 restriction endonuclease [Clostridium sp. 2-1]
MNAQDLKNSILQLAIQGKLVEQRKEEGTAKELIEEIKAEKERLIKEKKIKKEKPLAAITEDEVPFEIPESWEWVRLRDLGITQTGNTPSKSKLEYFGDYIPFISPGDILNGGINYENQGLSEKGKEVGRVSEKYSILQVCIGGSIGKCAINTMDVTYNQQINAITPILSDFLYIYYLMDSKFFLLNMRNIATGTATPIINKSAWETLLVPLPPLAEQKRIVAKIEDLMPYIEKYGTAHSKLEEFNKKFPEDMQKSILQYAIQGKLVEQREEEGTAEELYKQIQEEKEKLIKEKKIKKEKPLAEITEDEVPFEIPESWKWVRLGNLLNKLTDGAHSTPKYTDCGIPFISVKDISSGKIDFSNTKYISKEEHDSLFKRCNPELEDILLTKIGTTGIPVIVETNKEFSLFVSVALLKFHIDLIYNKYLLYAIKSPVVQMQCDKNTRGVGNKNWVMRDIANTILPLPPLAEQKRIVAKIEEMLPYCTQLVK